MKIEKGDHFGWPYCFYDQMQGKKVLAPEYGGDGTIIGRCADYKDPVIGFSVIGEQKNVSNKTLGKLKVNDILILTERIGSGIIFAGINNVFPLLFSN